jgi:hypothetical protein
MRVLGCLAAEEDGHGGEVRQAADNGSAQVIVPAEAAGLINQLRASGTVLTYDPDRRTLRSGDSGMIAVTAGQYH